MCSTKHNQGYSLVEVLVSIAVLLIAMVGPMAIAAQGIKSAAFALEQNTAFFLAQEGLEAMTAIRNTNALEDIADEENSIAWDWFDALFDTGGVCESITITEPCSFGIDTRNSDLENNITSSMCDDGNESNCQLYYDPGDARARYSHDSTGAMETPYTRIVTVESKDSYVVEVRVEVTWTSSVFSGAEQSVETVSTLFNFSL